MSKHELSFVVVANGAGRGICKCGWQSRVSDDGYMFFENYYTRTDIREDFLVHVIQEIIKDKDRKICHTLMKISQ